MISEKGLPNFVRPGKPAGVAAALLCAALGISAHFHSASASTLPSGFTETKLLSGINPTRGKFAPDGRFFYLEKNGKVRVFKNGALLPTPALSLDADFNEERGLLGIAFDPAFASGSPYLYLYYTNKSPAVHNRISRFKVEGDVVTGQEEVLVDLENLGQLRSGGWHNGGSLQFGKDGMLYITVGNNTISPYSQSLTILLGKVLRINPDGSIPTDNPFYGTATGNNRAIWALGLRNPFSSAVNPVTGKYYINDVGEGTWEEIDEGKAGANYGWPNSEGHAANAPTGLGGGTYSDPLSSYGHNGNCAIAGGTFYHPATNTFGTEYQDLYFFSDYCGGWIKTMDAANGNAVKAFATNIKRPIDLSVSADGSLYYLTRGVRPNGWASGSAEDNGSTPNGELYMVKGSKTTGIANPSLLSPAVIAAGRVSLPEGKSGLALYTLAGEKVWEYKGPKQAQRTWIDLPPGLNRGILQVRVF